MADYRILITDLTVYGALRCVAGWDLDRKKMVRPEPGPAEFWPSDKTGPGKVFNPGNVVSFSATKPKPPTDLPHLNEDRVVSGVPKLETKMVAAEFAQSLSKIATTAKAVFGRPAQFSNEKAYIARGTDCPSLYGINIDSDKLQFFEDTYKEKSSLRCRLILPSLPVNLSVGAVDLQELFASNGIAPIRARFPKGKQVHTVVFKTTADVRQQETGLADADLDSLDDELAELVAREAEDADDESDEEP